MDAVRSVASSGKLGFPSYKKCNGVKCGSLICHYYKTHEFQRSYDLFTRIKSHSSSHMPVQSEKLNLPYNKEY